MGRLIADLPLMKADDYAEFEKTVKPWGEQRSVRRNQLYTAGAGAAAGSIFGWVWPVMKRRNTSMVGAFMALSFGIGGGVIGHTAGTTLYPNVAPNDETTMMRRLWWAKKCSADCKYELPSDFVCYFLPY